MTEAKLKPDFKEDLVQVTRFMSEPQLKWRYKATLFLMIDANVAFASCAAFARLSNADTLLNSDTAELAHCNTETILRRHPMYQSVWAERPCCLFERFLKLSLVSDGPRVIAQAEEKGRRRSGATFCPQTFHWSFS